MSITSTVSRASDTESSSFHPLCVCNAFLCCSLVNKRLDEWVTPDRLDVKKLQFPKKEAKTPTKNGLPGSRPGSPEREGVRAAPAPQDGQAGSVPGRAASQSGESFSVRPSQVATVSRTRAPPVSGSGISGY